MMRLVTCIFIVVVSTSCLLAMSRSPKKPSSKSAYKTDVLTVFLTGNELGALQPCGCSGGQLGGFDRRSAVLNSVPAQRRLVVDTGSFVEGDSEQDLIKLNIIISAFDLLDYDLVNLAEKDVEIVQNLGLLNNLVVGFISSRELAGEKISARFTKQFLLKGKPVAVSVVAFDPESTPIQVEKIFPPQPNLQTVNILVLNRCSADIIASIAEMGTVDCFVCPAESDEPMVISDPNERPLVVSVGRFGKYVGRLQIRAEKEKDKLKFRFSAIPVTEDLPQEESLVELYKAYQQLVKEANLLEKQPRFVLPNGLEYTGSESCKLCHEYEYEKWSSKAHAHAYATLERIGSQFDPECVVCHVVGMEYESGFVSEEKTGYLKNVGCESCHGPGSEHIRTLGKAETSQPMLGCTDCHTPEESTNYADNEQLYWEKFIHWREPNTP